MPIPAVGLLDTLFGLPAHPLLVHAAVVLVPLCAIGTIVIVASARARERIGWVVAGLGVVGFVFAFLAKESGESLLETTRVTAAVRDHADLGDWGVIGAFLVGGSACAVMLLDLFVRERARRGLPELSVTQPVRNLVAVFAVVFCLAGTYAIVRVGHTGAKAVWEDKADTPSVTYQPD